MAQIPTAVRSAPTPSVIPPASVTPWLSFARPTGSKAAPVTNEVPPKLAPRTPRTNPAPPFWRQPSARR